MAETIVNEQKRTKLDADVEARPPAAPWQPPSAASLYEQGLQCKAEAHTTATSWTVDARSWRQAGFEGADPDGSHLRQKQIECRRMMLARSWQPHPAAS